MHSDTRSVQFPIQKHVTANGNTYKTYTYTPLFVYGHIGPCAQYNHAHTQRKRTMMIKSQYKLPTTNFLTGKADTTKK